MSRHLLLMVCLLAILTLTPHPVRADSGDARARLAITPVEGDRGYFHLEMEPGESRELTVELANVGDAPGTGALYEATAYTRVNGGFGGRMQDDEVTGAAEWLSVDRHQIFLAPGEGVQRAVSVAIPEDAQPGEHIAALVFEDIDVRSISASGGPRLHQRNRSLIAVFIDVSGPRIADLEIGDVDHSVGNRTSSIVFDLGNSGGERLNLDGEFRLEDLNGQVMLERDVEMDIFYAGHTTRLEVGLGDVLDPGEYRVWLVLRDSVRGVSSSVEGASLTVHEPDADAHAEEGITGLIQTPRLPGDGGSWWFLLGIVALVALLAAATGLLVGRRRGIEDTSGLPVTDTGNGAVSNAQTIAPGGHQATRRKGKLKPLLPRRDIS